MEIHRVVIGYSWCRLLLALCAARTDWPLGRRDGNDFGVLRLCQLWRDNDCMGALASARRGSTSASKCDSNANCDRISAARSDESNPVVQWKRSAGPHSQRAPDSNHRRGGSVVWVPGLQV